ncbi:MAG: hypothetical protein LRY69_06215 [Gammaproteobacteria bacterium]|nr:hypothetical protein [Gammaproteobacteria bacterium]
MLICLLRVYPGFFMRDIFLELFDDDLDDIAQHLRLEPSRDEEQTLIEARQEISSWAPVTKFFALFVAVGATLPLGLTKIGLDDEMNMSFLVLKLLYLTSYAVVEVAPHINHLQLQPQALSKFFELSWMSKFWVMGLIAGHAFSDSADLWNAKGFWLYWVCVGFLVECGLSNVEAVAHHKPHLPPLTMASAGKLALLFFASVSIALFNWYNTFNEEWPSMNNRSHVLFVVAQLVNIVFLTFEAWNHEGEEEEYDYSRLSQVSEVPIVEEEKNGSSLPLSSNITPSSFFDGFPAYPSHSFSLRT